MAFFEVGLPVNPQLDHDDAELARKSFLMLKLFPKVPKIVHDSRIMVLTNPSGAENPPPKMKIYFQPITIQDTFGNQLTNSLFTSVLQPLEKISQLVQMSNIQAHQLEEKLKHITIAGYSLGKMPKLLDIIMQTLWGYRFDFPKVWEDSIMEVSKEVRIYLRANPENNEDYNERILKPITYLLRYTLPKAAQTTVSDHYRWPFFCSVDAPGLFYLPEAMITNLIIDKGLGAIFGYNNRPSEVEVTIQFTPIRNVMVDDSTNKTQLVYTLTKYINNLKQKKQYPVGQATNTAYNFKQPNRSSLVDVSAYKQTYQNLNTTA